jgi:hypothetical protein
MNISSTTHCLAALLSLMAALSAHAGGIMTGPFSPCFPGQPGCNAITAIPATLSGSGRRMVKPQSISPQGSSPPGGTLTLQGQLDGEWDHVDGNVVFTYDFSATYPDVGRLQIFVRGMPALREAGTNRYSVEWDRSSYWLDFDGDGPQVPRLLPALQLVGSYVPLQTNDPYPEFADNPDVVADCTASTPCTIQLSEHTLLREPGVDYGSYPDLAAPADLLFVADRSGQAIAGVLDVYDENDEFVETKDLVEDDELQLSVVAYKHSEPQFIYIIQSTTFVALQPALRIELQNYIPGVDFQDPMLASDLNAGERRMKLLLDAYLENGSQVSWGFGGPFDLGFTWAHALDFLHHSSFESPQPAPNAAPQLVVAAH